MQNLRVLHSFLQNCTPQTECEICLQGAIVHGRIGAGDGRAENKLQYSPDLLHHALNVIPIIFQCGDPVGQAASAQRRDLKDPFAVVI